MEGYGLALMYRRVGGMVILDIVLGIIRLIRNVGGVDVTQTTFEPLVKLPVVIVKHIGYG